MLAIFRLLSLVLKVPWAKGWPKRQATKSDWVQHHQANPRHGLVLLVLLTRRLESPKLKLAKSVLPAPPRSKMSLMHPCLPRLPLLCCFAALLETRLTIEVTYPH